MLFPSMKVPPLYVPFAIFLALFIAVVALEYALSASDAAEFAVLAAPFAVDRAELAVLAASFAVDRAELAVLLIALISCCLVVASDKSLKEMAPVRLMSPPLILTVPPVPMKENPSTVCLNVENFSISPSTVLNLADTSV